MLCRKLISILHCYHRSQTFTSTTKILTATMPGIWPKLTRITNLWKGVSTGTIEYPTLNTWNSRRQVGYIFVHLCFGECSVFRPLVEFSFVFNPSVWKLQTSYQLSTQVIKFTNRGLSHCLSHTSLRGWRRLGKNEAEYKLWRLN